MLKQNFHSGVILPYYFISPSRDSSLPRKYMLSLFTATQIRGHKRHLIEEVIDPLTFHRHCAKSVNIRSFFGPHFPTFGLNTEKYSSLRIQSECGKIRTRKNLNMNTFHAVRDCFHRTECEVLTTYNYWL